MSEMKFKSVGLTTNLIFHRPFAQIADRGDYVAIRTPARPDYFWGNYLVFREAPRPGCLEAWLAAFEREIGPRSRTGFMALTWDDPGGAAGDLSAFLDFGFTAAFSCVLTATEVQKPANYNSAFQVRALQSAADWETYLDVHLSEPWGYGTAKQQRDFTAGQRDDLRGLAEAGLGLRFGAFLDGQPASELGLYWNDTHARFNNVGTHAALRRRGACSTLVYEASKAVLAKRKGTTLVIEAAEGAPAARLYKALGFSGAETLCKLEWVKRASCSP